MLPHKYLVSPSAKNRTNGYVRVCEDDKTAISQFEKSLRYVLVGYDSSALILRLPLAMELNGTYDGSKGTFNVSANQLAEDFIGTVVKNCANALELTATKLETVEDAA